MAEYNVDRITYGGNTYQFPAIDDTAGTGDTHKTWSANKLSSENTLTKTITTPAAIQTFSDGAAWPMEMEIAVEAVQAGSGDPSPSNVRAISGWDYANIITDGKNLIKNLKYQHNTYTIRLGADDNSHSYFLIPGTYTLSANNSDAAYLYYHEVNDSASTRFSELTTNSTGSFTVAKAGWYRFHLYSSNAISASNVTQFQLEFGETATTYEPYKGNTYNITFPSTCYGGTLTVHADGTGEIEVDNAQYSFNGTEDFNLSGDGTNQRRFDINIVSKLGLPAEKTSNNEFSSHFKQYANNNGVYGQFYISSPWLVFQDRESHFASKSDFLTWLAGQNAAGTPVQICYPLATPITYTLSAPQVLSLLGLNNVWADCGNINKISYVRRQDLGFIREDTKGQIKTATDQIQTELNDTESSLAIVIDGDTAPKAITSGQYLFIKNHSTLATGSYHATAAIAKDASVTSNNTSPDADGIANSILNTVTITATTGITDLRCNAFKINNYVIIHVGRAVLPSGVTRTSWTAIASVSGVSIEGVFGSCCFRDSNGIVVGYGILAYDATLGQIRVMANEAISGSVAVVGSTLITKIG